MKPALLLVDLQRDFLEARALTPPPQDIVAQAAALLVGWRAAGLPVFHAHTLVRPDGADAMPHWRSRGVRACVRGSPGAAPPDALLPLPGEPVIAKRFYSAFEDDALERALRTAQADAVVLCGVHLHACVRESALDAYRRGYRVLIAEDAVGSAEPGHALLTREWLAARAADFLPVRQLLARFVPGQPADAQPSLPLGRVAGRELEGRGRRLLERRDPCDWSRVQAQVPLAEAGDVAQAAAAAAAARAAWAGRSAAQRAEVLRAWAGVLERRAGALAESVMREIGKPVAQAGEELARAVGHVRASAARCAEANGTGARRRPLGVVGLITPWNNPVAIPAGKIAPALAWGNAVVWKPAPEAPRSALLLLETLVGAGVPAGLVNLLFGDAAAGGALAREPAVDAVSITGSRGAGLAVAHACLAAGKPVQAEMGGNSAALVMPDADLRRVAEVLAGAAFDFAGQRCTATRRFVVLEGAWEAFVDALRGAVQALAVGRPDDPATRVGPLVSRQRRDAVEEAVARALADGATRVCEGRLPPGLDAGCWLAPQVLACEEPAAAIVQQESFGPVAVLQRARDVDHALALVNGVPQGLAASLYGGGPQVRQRFLDEARAGLLRIDDFAPAIDPDLPFAGWKASGIGPAEHGEADREFYSLPQAVYRP